MKEYAIYSAIVGGYDDIKQPLVIDDRFDYILFSNDIPSSRVGIWQVLPIPYANEDKTRIARYVKTHPEQLLAAYKASIWMDGTLQIATPYIYRKFDELEKDGVLLSSVKHLARECLYEEMVAVLGCLFETEEVILRWGKQLRKEGFPRYQGLTETNVLYRRHQDGRVKAFDSLWWSCINQFSKRDQLSFNYCAWKLNIDVPSILPKGECAAYSKEFVYQEHANDKKKYVQLKTPFMHHWMKKNGASDKDITDVYYKLFALPRPQIWTLLVGQYYRYKYLTAYYIKRILKKSN